MQNLIDKARELWKNLNNKAKNPQTDKLTAVATSYEVNLVPDVKIQMIQAQKIRNLVLFICIVVSIASVGVVLVLLSIKSGQDIAMATQDSKLEKMSEKLNSYEELGDLVTVQRQLEKISQLSGDKPVLSRVFGALAVVLPQGNDVVQLSELRAELTDNLLRFEGQADAKTSPLIDYRVLEALKKGIALSKYDYGRFVDATGNEIPTWCINEADGTGVQYREGEDYYVWWELAPSGCGAVATDVAALSGSGIELKYNPDAEVEMSDVEITEAELEERGIVVEEDGDELTTSAGNIEVRKDGDTLRFYEKRATRVKVWRTPQFNEWYQAGYMDLDGGISGVEHFVSECTQYSGALQGGDGTTAKWTSTNDCMLAPEGMNVLSSSNGRDENENLVLKFTATVTFDEEFFAFRNKHMIAIGPMGQNVTDSYVQIGGMFTQEAKDCERGDTECLKTSTSAEDD